MSATLERTATVVNLEAVCREPACNELARRMHTQLGIPKYMRGVSVLAVPESLAEWRSHHRTARKRSDRAGRLGYRFEEIDRSQHTDDLYAINTSLPVRQGRPMSDGYMKRIVHGSLTGYTCERHYVRAYGILTGDTLVAYLTNYRVGDLVLVSMILGHGDHLANDIMYRLFSGLVEREAGRGGVMYYNRWDSGLDGLRFYKTRVGFSEGDVCWSL